MKTNSLIVKDTGIHVSDGEVTVICQNQTQAKDLIELHHTWCLDDLKKDHPYPIPGLRFEITEEPIPCPDGKEGCLVNHFRKVAILSVEEETDPRDLGLDDSWIHDVDMGAK